MPDGLRLTASDASALIYPTDGGRLGQLDFGDGPVLRGPTNGTDWSAWGCYPLVPWSNRIPSGHLRFGVIDSRLPVNWHDGSAIHGLVASRAWTVKALTDSMARLDTVAKQDPYRLKVEQRFELASEDLTLKLAVTNVGNSGVPVGIGIHPWFVAGPIRVPANRKWPGDPLPTGPAVPVDSEDDFRDARVAPPMDRCFTGLTDTSVDVPGVRLHWSGPISQVVVYSGEPGWVCVEPVTMANDGFGLAQRGIKGHGVHVFQPGERIAVDYRFERRRAVPDPDRPQ